MFNAHPFTVGCARAAALLHSFAVAVGSLYSIAFVAATPEESPFDVASSVTACLEKCDIRFPEKSQAEPVTTVARV